MLVVRIKTIRSGGMTWPRADLEVGFALRLAGPERQLLRRMIGIEKTKSDAVSTS